jgi:Tfp pilus assembly protein PilO
MTGRLLRLRHELGALGWLSIAIIGLAAAFAFLAVKPLEARNAALAERVAQLSSREQPGSAAGKVASVYGFLEKPEQTTDWLAKLHGIGTATGVQLKSASYKTQPTDGRIVRYEIVLPVAGSYPQIRDFLKRSLAEIPVLSVDQLTLKRDSGQGAGPVHAELRLTLHMVKS